MLRFFCGLLALTSMFLAGCATDAAQQKQNDRILAQQETMDGSACFKVKDVDSWRVLNEHFLIVYAPTINRPWLVQLAQRCGNLRSGSIVAFSGTLHERQVCAKETELLLGNVGCSISAIYPMTKQQSIDLIEKNNKAREEREAKLKNG